MNGKTQMPPRSTKKLLLIGASRGLGFALAEEYLKRGWQVVATERNRTTSHLHTLVTAADGRLEIETVDIVHPDQVAALRARLAGRAFDLLFVNAGVTNDNRETIADVSTDEFMRVMVTNSLSPMRVVEALQDLVAQSGTIAIMSSGQGSIGNNESGQHEVYRGSKAALNMFMRSFAARHADDPRTLLLMAPGWVRTDLGGPQARLSVEESIPNLINTIEAQRGRKGLQYLDYLGRTIPW
jgi:NAD(P)-dependent dehydrogenase (short-subunit alcohol dehydrogenase family)